MSTHAHRQNTEIPQREAAGRKARIIAFYLPQFHPIPENDLWWGAGFTEWTNVAKAKPLFPGHFQPRLPADLGFYDLRVPEVRAAQANMARAAGIEGFCYWHYWFAGKRLLERPFNEVLSSKEPDFPFCLGWANQTWTGIWHGASDKTLMEQTYPGPTDNERHFYEVLPAFQDPRYLRVDGQPLFLLYRPTEFPEVSSFMEQWRRLAVKNGLPGVHFVAHLLPQNADFPWRERGFSAETLVAALQVSSPSIRSRFNREMNGSKFAFPDGDQSGLGDFSRLGFYAARRALEKAGLKQLSVWHYKDAMKYFLEGVTRDEHCYPCIVPNWDNSPRSGKRAVILHGATPELFRQHLRESLQLVSHKTPEHRIIFAKSWNEWAEGNYLEPDSRYGRAYLDVLAEELVPAPRKSA